MSCRVGRDICFKTFIKGSAFGDLEVFAQKYRLFSTQAETDLRLCVIDREELFDALSKDANSEKIILGNIVHKYINYSHSINRIKPYDMTAMNSPWWEDEDTAIWNVNKKVDQWLLSIQQSYLKKQPGTGERFALSLRSRNTLRRLAVNSNFTQSSSGAVFPNARTDTNINLHSVSPVRNKPFDPHEQLSCKSDAEQESKGLIYVLTTILEEIDTRAKDLGLKLEEIRVAHHKLRAKQKKLETYFSNCKCGAADRHDLTSEAKNTLFEERYCQGLGELRSSLQVRLINFEECIKQNKKNMTSGETPDGDANGYYSSPTDRRELQKPRHKTVLGISSEARNYPSLSNIYDVGAPSTRPVRTGSSKHKSLYNFFERGKSLFEEKAKDESGFDRTPSMSNDNPIADEWTDRPGLELPENFGHEIQRIPAKPPNSGLQVRRNSDDVDYYSSLVNFNSYK